ncbi:recombinase family protein [Tannockella kyphosi]|uniref:recombinase family protein n=1 Tax=Tannockella kyphosi TaxID=2899121 RepID=UPI0020119753|nr:recombinase family protein [Tannockella kyphosi]
MSVAMYIRLSDADEDTGFSKTESDSVVNQRLYINDYINKQTSLSRLARFEFVDDGYTGTNDERPSLNKMMEAVRSGIVKIICVKDFSRFFRDYIEAGNYLECVFPFLGVRFISINDNYDSDDYKGTTGGLEMVMRNIIYTAYSKDLSLKVSSGKLELIKKGKFIGSHAPYGYKKDPNDKNKIIIDDESAKVVRLIFDSAMNGKTVREITLILNEKDIPTKSQYFKLKYPDSNKYNYMYEKIHWQPSRVYDILKNSLYKGDMVSLRKKKVSFNSKKLIKQDPIIIEDNHQGIVTKQEFEEAQKVIKISKQASKKNYIDFPLRGLVRCGHCQYLMDRVKKQGVFYFKCKSALNGKIDACKTNIDTDEGTVEGVVFHAIMNFIAFTKQEDIKQTKPTSYDLTIHLTELSNKIAGLKQSKLRLYEKYTCDELTRENYIKQKQECDKKIKLAEEQISEYEVKLREQAYSEKEKPVIGICDKYISESKLTKEMVNAFIKTVYVFDKDTIHVEFKYKNVFEER